MTEELIAWAEGREIGRVNRTTRGRLSFRYERDWQEADDAYPLSLSMPLAAQEHGPTQVEAYLWGLLPDNGYVLERWAKNFQVSARNAFALLSTVGEDCAGAVQFVRPERLDVLKRGEGQVEWLSEADIAARLQALRTDHAAWRLQSDMGQFSLAGAQPKTALLYENGRWGIPSGDIPTTHILKPPTGRFDGHAENEHVCLSLGRALGMPAAETRVLKFGDEVAIVVTRYDRIRRNNRLTRVHQEDVCQALGLMPARKYQNDGGPGIKDIVELLRLHSSARDEDVESFIDAVAFNWLIAGTDAHAKNYSLLIGSGRRVRLAPLYDVASILPYDDFDLKKVRLSMKIGGEYRIRDIDLGEWQKLARDVRVDSDKLIERIADLAKRIPDELAKIRSSTKKDGLDQPIIERLVARMTDRAAQCLKTLASAGKAALSAAGRSDG